MSEGLGVVVYLYITAAVSCSCVLFNLDSVELRPGDSV